MSPGFSVLSLAIYQMSPCFLMATLPDVGLDLGTLIPFSYHQDEPQWEQMQLANRNDQLILYGQKSILTNDNLLDQNRCRFIGFINGILSISHFLYYWEWIEVTLNWLKQWVCEHGELMVTLALQTANNTEEQPQESITDCHIGERDPPPPFPNIWGHLLLDRLDRTISITICAAFYMISILCMSFHKRNM